MKRPNFLFSKSGVAPLLRKSVNACRLISNEQKMVLYTDSTNSCHSNKDYLMDGVMCYISYHALPAKVRKSNTLSSKKRAAKYAPYYLN